MSRSEANDSEIKSSVQEIYVAMLGRAADSKGLQYWTDQIIAGNITTDTIRQAFMPQPEYIELYQGLSNSGFITKVYENVLSRAPDAAGEQYWLDQLNNNPNLNHDQFILTVLTAAKENAGADATLLLNKVTAANSFTKMTEHKTVDAAFNTAAGQIIKVISTDPISIDNAFTLANTLRDTLNSDVLFNLNFEQHKAGAYTEAMLDKDAGKNSDATNIVKNANIIDSNGDKKLSITMEAGVIKEGLQFYTHFTDSQVVKFSYEIEFKSGFHFGKGIKLPGLGAKVGTENPTGGNDVGENDGFSLRGMVREAAANAYIYDQKKAATFGEDIPYLSQGKQLSLVTDKVYKIDQIVKMNSKGIANGELLVTFDNETVLHLNDRIWSESGDNGVNTLFFDLWPGGSTMDFALNSHSEIWVDDITVEALPIDTLL